MVLQPLSDKRVGGGGSAPSLILQKCVRRTPEYEQIWKDGGKGLMNKVFKDLNVI